MSAPGLCLRPFTYVANIIAVLREAIQSTFWDTTLQKTFGNGRTSGPGELLIITLVILQFAFVQHLQPAGS